MHSQPIVWIDRNFSFSQCSKKTNLFCIIIIMKSYKKICKKSSINNQKTCSLSYWMHSLIFRNAFEFFQNFLTILRISFSKNIRGCKREAVSWIIRIILECDMESSYKNMFKIRKIPFIFLISFFFQNYLGENS